MPGEGRELSFEAERGAATGKKDGLVKSEEAECTTAQAAFMIGREGTDANSRILQSGGR